MARKGDGASGRVRNTTAFAIGSAYTFVGWFKAASVPAATGATIVFGATAASGLYRFQWNGGAVGSETAWLHGTNNSGGNTIYQLPSPPSVGVWTHFAAVWDGSNVTIYQNGSPVVGPSSQTASYTNADLVFGALSDPSGVGSKYWDGTVDDVVYWTVALSAAEIAQLAMGVSPAVVHSSNMFVGWTMNGTSPEPDISGNGRTGTVTDTAVGDHSPAGFIENAGQYWADVASYELFPSPIAVNVQDSTITNWADGLSFLETQSVVIAESISWTDATQMQLTGADLTVSLTDNASGYWSDAVTVLLGVPIYTVVQDLGQLDADIRIVFNVKNRRRVWGGR